MWIKSILIPFIILLFYILKDICKILDMSEDTSEKVIALIIATPIFMFSISVMGQYDIIAIFIIMLAIRSYLLGNIKRFIFWMSIAMPFKRFAIFEIPLLLIIEKRFLYKVKLFLWLVFFISYGFLYLEIIETYGKNVADDNSLFLSFVFLFINHDIKWRLPFNKFRELSSVIYFTHSIIYGVLSNFMELGMACFYLL